MRRLLAGALATALLGLACGAGPRRCEALRDRGGLRLVYEVEGGGAPAIRDALRRRLDDAGARCSDARVEGDEVVVELVGEASPELQSALGRPGHLRIRPALPEARAAELEALLPEPRPGDGASDGELRAWVAALRAVLPGGIDVLLEPEAPGRSPRVHLLEAGAGLTDPEVSDARAVLEAGIHAVALTLAGPSAAAFADLTAAHVGEVLVVELDGEVLTAPVLMERLKGGRFSIAVPPVPEPRAWCERVSGALRSGALPGRITLASVSVVEPAVR